MTREASCELENELFKSVYDKTPDYIKNLNLIDFNNDGEFVFTLKREYLNPYDAPVTASNINTSIPE